MPRFFFVCSRNPIATVNREKSPKSKVFKIDSPGNAAIRESCFSSVEPQFHGAVCASQVCSTSGALQISSACSPLPPAMNQLGGVSVDCAFVALLFAGLTWARQPCKQTLIPYDFFSS